MDTEEIAESNPTSLRLRRTGKSFFRRFWWIFTAIALVLIGFGGYNYWRLVYNVAFHGDELQKAETALKSGITINDNKNDFVMLGSNKEELNAEDNPSPYRLEEVDIKDLRVGADKDYFYYKVGFYKASTKNPPVVNGDTVESVGTVMDVFDTSGKTTAVIHGGFGWWPVLNVPVVDTFYSTGPTGIVWPESARFTTENRDSKVYGGPGKDYILARFPMKSLGLKYGDTMIFDIGMEVSSAEFTHAAVDILQGSGKTPGLITWKIGSSSYTIDNEEHNTSENKFIKY